MFYYIEKDGKITGTSSVPLNEEDLASRHEKQIISDVEFELGWVRDGDAFSPPPFQIGVEIPKAISLVNQRHAEVLQNLTGDATIEERDTWQAKALAAEALQAGRASAIQQEMIAGEASVVGETIDQLVQTILAKHGAYQTLIGLASGLRRKTKTALSAASSKDDIDQILAASDKQSKQLVQQWQERALETDEAQAQ